MNSREKKTDQVVREAMPERFSISDEDIHGAMKDIPGYLDITTGDFKELYAHSYRHALDRIINSVRAGDVMTRKVFSVRASTSLLEVAELMASSGVSGMPVLDTEDNVAGIISERDFLKNMGAVQASFMEVVAACLRGKGCAALNIRKGTAGDIMSAPVISMGPDATLGEVAAIMTRHNINRVPVVDGPSGKLLGILTRADMVKAQVFGGGGGHGIL